MKFVASCYHWTLTVLTMLWYVVTYGIMKKVKPATDHFEHFWHMAKNMVRRSGIDLQVDGLENVDPQQPYIIMFNHINVMDHVAIYYALHRKITGLQKEDNLTLPIYGTLMRQFGIIPIAPRGDTKKAIAALDIAKEKFKEGVSILVAPEGTRCHNGKLGNFKKGGFHMALDMQAPILPVMYDETMLRYNGRRKFLLGPGPVRLSIKKPMSVEGYGKENLPELISKVRNLYVEHIGSEYYKT